MSIARHHAEWLSLLEISGPFLSMPVLMNAFPQGLEVDDVGLRGELRLAYEEWQDVQGGLRPDPAIHGAWVAWVLDRVLDFPADALRRRPAPDDPGADAWPRVKVAEHGETLTPDLLLVEPPDPFAPGTSEPRPRLLIQIMPPGQSLDKPMAGSRWKASPATRMMTLLRGADVRLGLLTNGEQWMLVDAPRDQTTGFISWYAELWLDEPLTLRAVRTLLGARRFFGVPGDETLEALLRESVDDQHDVTDRLGHQVRRAVELLIQAVDVADQDQGRRLLRGIAEETLYEGAVTVMMRLVFLLAAEERGLLLLGDPVYDEYYAASTLRVQLHDIADQFGEELLERRHDAWYRLLALFRAVHGGINHERLHMPAYGGSLFDPDRFPWLEGRFSQGSDDQGDDQGGDPGAAMDRGLLIDNRTVLHLLDALQLLQVKTPGGGPAQAQRLSFRALGVEQIGHVYEGLLDHAAVRADTPVLGLTGTKNKEPEIKLPDLEQHWLDAEVNGDRAYVKYLREQTGRSPAALRRAISEEPDPEWLHRLRAACGHDRDLFERVKPFANLIREDDYGRPAIIPAGSLYVTLGSERRATGSHYTPPSLTEPIVQHTLEPLVYVGPAQGKLREEWALRSPAELLSLKICDMAMGSGAFLVQSCRYLGERLVESLEMESLVRGRAGRKRGGDGLDPLAALRAASGDDERLILARRLVAERCLYGVDKNPLAVEMAKLSLWLVTMHKGRAFGFLDHAFKSGDSLLGVDLEQLSHWNLETRKTPEIFAHGFRLDAEKMVTLRQEIESMPVVDIQDQRLKGYLLADADAIAHDLKAAADMLVASYYNTLKSKQQAALRNALLGAVRDGADVAEEWWPHAGLDGLTPFHWPLEFPEVFLGEGRTGFDAFVGNPPFIGGQRIRASMGGAYLSYLKTRWNHAKGSADYSAYFFLRAFENLRPGGALGLIATNTIAQGSTRELGLAYIANHGGVIFSANNNYPWPGQAAVVINIVHIFKGTYQGELRLDDRSVKLISPLLDDMPMLGPPQKLKANENLSFQGSNVLGLGFTMPPDEAKALVDRNPKNADILFPYLNGQDLNSHPEQQSSRWVINFFDWPLERSAPGRWTDADEKQRKAWLRSGMVPADYPDPVAADYPDCLAIVREKVYPQRMKQRREIRKRYWWRYGEVAPALYRAIAPLRRVLVIAQTSRTLAFDFVPKGIVYSHMTVVIASEDDWLFTILQSNFHIPWVLRYAAALKNDARYLPSDVFETFPFPSFSDFNLRTLSAIGEAYYEHRRQIMLDRQEGLTKTYNRFHDSDEAGADIVRLRELHVEMDQAVASAYGWGPSPSPSTSSGQALTLDHGFHETPQGLRYTISEPARREILARLLALNHARYAEEVAAGLHDKSKGKKAGGSKKVAEGQLGLFGG